MASWFGGPGGYDSNLSSTPGESNWPPVVSGAWRVGRLVGARTDVGTQSEEADEGTFSAT